MSSPRIRVVIYLRDPEGDPGRVEKEYQRISWVRGDLHGDPIPGLVGCGLLKDVDRFGEYVLHGEWESLKAYRAWQLGPDHADNPSPLRPYQDRSRGRHYAVYAVTQDG